MKKTSASKRETETALRLQWMQKIKTATIIELRISASEGIKTCSLERFDNAGIQASATDCRPLVVYISGLLNAGGKGVYSGHDAIPRFDDNLDVDR